MKKLPLFIWAFFLFASVLFSTASAFTSLYVFGDGICTTTNNESGGAWYYGKRFSNGRVWIEVLSQRQGLAYVASKNWSYFGQDCDNLTNNISHFSTPSDAATALFVVWANDADFVGWVNNNTFGPPYTTNSLPLWTNAFNRSLTNHFKAVTNLYAKGARTLILPNAVDIMQIPQYDNASASDRSFIRQRVVSYNQAFTNMLNQAKAVCPGLVIYVPDVFSLLDNVLTNASYYGLTNALYDYGQGSVSIDAINAPFITAATNGAGTNFIFWDPINITAKMHAVLADYVQQQISPVRFSVVPQINGTNRLDVVNMPVGLSGVLEGSTNLANANWTFATNFTGTTTTQALFVPAPPLPANFGSGGGGGGGGSIDPTHPGTNTVTYTNSAPYVNVNVQLYRLRFPYAWVWP